jgi:hypothetical protein
LKSNQHVHRRLTHEIGIRMAVDAPAGEIFRMLLREA